jgi:hypothetical protein
VVALEWLVTAKASAERILGAMVKILEESGGRTGNA